MRTFPDSGGFHVPLGANSLIERAFLLAVQLLEAG
jgi:hypothetical protein